MEPKTIEPQDIRVGMRVRVEQHLGDDVRTVEFTVSDRDGDLLFSERGRYSIEMSEESTWTLLADAPKPDRPVGSHWRDPETGAEYVATDDPKCAFEAYSGIDRGDRDWHPGALHIDSDDDPIIARLVPIPAFDPATLWPELTSGPACGVKIFGSDHMCDRSPHKAGLHACHHNDGEIFVWGDPR